MKLNRIWGLKISKTFIIKYVSKICLNKFLEANSEFVRAVIGVQIPAFSQFVRFMTSESQPFLSEPVMIRGLSWRVVAKVFHAPRPSSSSFGGYGGSQSFGYGGSSSSTFLGLSLRREVDKKKNEYCHVSAEFRIKAQRDGVADLSKTVQHTFYPTENSESVSWRDTVCSVSSLA